MQMDSFKEEWLAEQGAGAGASPTQAPPDKCPTCWVNPRAARKVRRQTGGEDNCKRCAGVYGRVFCHSNKAITAHELGKLIRKMPAAFWDEPRVTAHRPWPDWRLQMLLGDIFPEWKRQHEAGNQRRAAMDIAKGRTRKRGRSGNAPPAPAAAAEVVAVAGEPSASVGTPTQDQGSGAMQMPDMSDAEAALAGVVQGGVAAGVASMGGMPSADAIAAADAAMAAALAAKESSVEDGRSDTDSDWDGK